MLEKNKKRPIEIREKISLTMKGRKLSENHKKNISEANKGRLFSEEHKKKISESKKGNKACLGRKCSEETKRKMREIMKGENNPRWKGGKYRNSQGYIEVRTENGYTKEHRLVMEKYLGRKLDRWEFIHHKNGIKTDNRIENLEIVINKAHFGQIRCPYCQKDFLIK